MIELRNIYPRNKAHVLELLACYREILAFCRDLDVTPILSGSLAVFAYTQDQNMEVRDIDLACSERTFPRLRDILSAQGMACRLTAWHVLQVRQGHLKVEFDSLEHWMKDLPRDYETLTVDDTVFNVLRLTSLTELYRRGLEATATQDDKTGSAKRAALLEKYRALHRLLHI